MEKRILILLSIAGGVLVFALALATGSFFYFKGMAAGTSPDQNNCSKDELSAVYEALEECQSDLAGKNEKVATSTASAIDNDDENAFKCCDNTFSDFTSLKYGDCYACAGVEKSIDNDLSKEVIFAPHNADVMAYLIGTYKCLDNSSTYDTEVSWHSGSVCFTPDDDSSLPRFEGDKSKQSFCFADDEDKYAEDFFCSEDRTGRALVWINKYSYVYKNSNSYNTALKWSAELQAPMPGVEIGAKMSGMTVKSYSNESYKKEIKFSGKARVTGDYIYYDEGEYDGGWACFSDLDAFSEARIPKFPGEENEKSRFCVRSNDFVKKLISKSSSGRATVDIDNFNLIYCQCGAWTNAELVGVVSVEEPKVGDSDCPTAFDDFSMVKDGDCYGGMTASDVKVGYAGKQEGNILFKALSSGDKKISGEYKYYQDDYAFVGGQVCFYPDSREILPKVKSDNRDTWFCFSNQDKAREEFGPIGSSGRATIYISDYYYLIAGTEGWNKATLERVSK